MWRVGSEYSRLGAEVIRTRVAVANGKFWEPRADVLDHGDRVSIRVELAGVRPEDIEIMYNAERHAIAVRGVRLEDDLSGERSAPFQLEIPYGEFAREIPLPDYPIKTKSIRAVFRNGFLHIEAQRGQRLAVRTTFTIENI